MRSICKSMSDADRWGNNLQPRPDLSMYNKVRGEESNNCFPVLIVVDYLLTERMDQGIQLDESAHVSIHKSDEIYDNKHRQSPNEVPFFGLVSDEIHGKQPTNRAADET